LVRSNQPGAHRLEELFLYRSEESATAISFKRMLKGEGDHCDQSCDTFRDNTVEHGSVSEEVDDREDNNDAKGAE
jgi:hypothetical protein